MEGGSFFIGGYLLYYWILLKVTEMFKRKKKSQVKFLNVTAICSQPFKTDNAEWQITILLDSINYISKISSFTFQISIYKLSCLNLQWQVPNVSVECEFIFLEKL